MICRYICSRLQSYSVLFVVLGLLWGGSFVAIEIGLRSFPPLLFAALRYDVAGVVVLGYAMSTTDRWWPATGDDWRAVGVAAVLVVGLYQALLFTGEQYVSGAVAAILVSLSPVLSAGFAAALVPGQALRRGQYLGVALGFLGVVLVVDPLGTSAAPAGVGLVLLAVASFSLGSVLVRPLSPSLPAPSLQAWAMLGGAFLLHTGSALSGEPVPAAPGIEALATLAYLALGAGAGGFLLYFRLLDRVGAAELNLVSYIEPVVATGLSWLLLERTVGPATLLGFLVIFAGFLAVKRRAARALATAGVRHVRRRLAG